MELDEILLKVWRNGYQINRWNDLKQELQAYFEKKLGE